jgi:hypothetical protein
MNKILKIAVMLVALTSVFAFANKEKDKDSKGGFEVGFYGSLGNATGQIGTLFSLGNGLEIGLGLGIGSSSETIETKGTISNKEESSDFSWKVIPSVSYQFGKKEFVGYGAGLDIGLSSWSKTRPVPGGNGTETTKPKNIDMAFFPNFFIKAEVVKNFYIGLKTGVGIGMPGDDEVSAGGTTTTTSYLSWNTATEVFVAFYL